MNFLQRFVQGGFGAAVGVLVYMLISVPLGAGQGLSVQAILACISGNVQWLLVVMLWSAGIFGLISALAHSLTQRRPSLISNLAVALISVVVLWVACGAILPWYQPVFDGMIAPGVWAIVVASRLAIFPIVWLLLLMILLATGGYLSTRRWR